MQWGISLTPATLKANVGRSEVGDQPETQQYFISKAKQKSEETKNKYNEQKVRKRAVVTVDVHCRSVRI